MRAQQKPIIDKYFYMQFNDIIAAFQLYNMCTQNNFLSVTKTLTSTDKSNMTDNYNYNYKKNNKFKSMQCQINQKVTRRKTFQIINHRNSCIMQLQNGQNNIYHLQCFYFTIDSAA